MASFLYNRSQRVKIGDVFSKTGFPNGGVPQGTLSGPKCFMAYINNLKNTFDCISMLMIPLFFSYVKKIRNQLFKNLLMLSMNGQWTLQNDMKLNPDKSKEMIISFSKDNDVMQNSPYVNINGIQLARVKSAVLLGVTISHDLSWNEHIDNVVSKAAKRYI